MSKEDRNIEGEGGRGGSLLLATLLGVGVGLLAAPQAGAKTRRALGRRLAALSEDVMGDELEELRELGGRAGRKVRDRAERLRARGHEVWDDASERLSELQEEFEEDESDGSGTLGTVLTLAAGFAAAYFLTSERAAPARERVREAAATVRDEAEERWGQFKRNRAGSTESARADTESAPQTN